MSQSLWVGDKELRKKARQWHNQKYKERPICRKQIEYLMSIGYFIEDIAMGYMKNYNAVFASFNLRCQARKMMKESGQLTIIAYDIKI